MQTWAVSEVDKKGKKKKGTLGIGSGAIFFASESDKVCLHSLVLERLYLESCAIDACSKVADRCC